MARPGSEATLDRLRDLGVTALITLTETPLPEEWLARSGLVAHHWPIADYTAPPVAQAAQIVADIQALLDAQQVVVVHCAGGLGRTGTILACYLVAQGMPAPEAIAAIRAQRPGSIETDQQADLVALYERTRKGGFPGR